jgi:hypothetical protein
MRKYDMYWTSANGSYAEETSFDYERSMLEPVTEEEEDADEVLDSKPGVGDRKKSRLGRIFSKFRHRKGYARPSSVSSTRVETGSFSTTLSIQQKKSRETRDDDTTVAVDNTTAHGNFRPPLTVKGDHHYESRLAADGDSGDEANYDDDDGFMFPDDVSTTALASLPDENKDSFIHGTYLADDIWIACKIGDENYIRGITLTSPETVHEVKDGRSPLYLASLCGHENIVRMLLDAGASDYDGSAELSALSQRIRAILKDHRKRSLTEASPDVASKDASISSPIAFVDASSIPLDEDAANTKDARLIEQLSSLSAESSNSSNARSGSTRSGVSSALTAPPSARHFIRRIPSMSLLRDGLYSPKKFSIPDLALESSNQPRRKKDKKDVQENFRNLKLLESGIESQVTSKGSGNLINDSLAGTILSTSFIDCSEVVLPDLFFEAPPVEAYYQSNDALHSTAPLGSSDASSRPLSNADAATTATSEPDLPPLIEVRTYDAKELLPRLDSSDKELPTLKASVCGVTAVLEEDNVEEARPKVMMSWVESGFRDHQLISSPRETLTFDSEEYISLDQMKSDCSLDKDDIGFFSMFRDCVCLGFGSVSQAFKKVEEFSSPQKV